MTIEGECPLTFPDLSSPIVEHSHQYLICVMYFLKVLHGTEISNNYVIGVALRKICLNKKQ